MSRRLFVEFTCDRCGLVELKPAEPYDWMPLRLPPPADWLRANYALGIGDSCPKCAESK